MKTYHYTQSLGFNPEVVQNLLLNIVVASEVEARFGVPAARLEQWLQELLHRLGAEPQKPPMPKNNGRRLSAGEIRFLLDGFEVTETLDG